MEEDEAGLRKLETQRLLKISQNSRIQILPIIVEIHTNRCYLYYRKLTTVPSKKCGSVLTNPDFFTRDRSKIPGNIDNTGLYEAVEKHKKNLI